MSLENREVESDSDSDFEGATHEVVEESFLGVTVLGQLMEPIKEVISMLLRTSMVIRKPAPHDHFGNFNQVSTTHFEEFDLRHVQDKFPMASPTLVKRLARATSSRHNYLKYREDRQINLSAGLDSLGDCGQENKTSAYTESGRGGGPFQCPPCFGIISAKTENSWKKHVSKDLAPYVCTFDSCSTPFRRFEKRREWFEHELSHRSKWKCPLNCEIVFNTQEYLSEHLKGHSGTFIDPSGECQVRPDATSSVGCALRPEVLPLAQLQSHLGEHQQQLALFALPLQIRNSENDEEFDDDSEDDSEVSVEEDRSDTEASADEEDNDSTTEEAMSDSLEVDSEAAEEAAQAP
ncbi:hypothetical protein BKA81DRAFT_379048 [Phyllosticta paracitricarpa]|uniref:C2H2-type domain-containing protein n=1 Tax=Phyllosticta citricarpa TaxID=55181 RepID=A0ABR1LBV5_9PEZI